MKKKADGMLNKDHWLLRNEKTVSNKEYVLPVNRIRNCQSSLINIVDKPETPISGHNRKIKKNDRKMNIWQTNLTINTKSKKSVKKHGVHGVLLMFTT